MSKSKQSVKSILDNFRKNIFGIEYYFNKFGNIAQGSDEDGLHQTAQYVLDCFKEVGIDTGVTPEERKQNIGTLNKGQVALLGKKLLKQPKISTQNYDILSKSAFLMLNNYFEYLLADLLSYYYNKFQKSLDKKDFSIALRELSEFESIEDFTKYLITKEVESMMVEFTFDGLLDHFHKTLGVDKEDSIINWSLILECRERRHLIVHNSSIVNKKYLARTKNPFNLNVGDIIIIENEYFLNACKEFFLAGLLLSYNAWGKWDKETATNAIKEITNDSFELLKQNDNVLVSRFTNYIDKIEAKNEDEEDCLMRAKFNRMIALKKLDHKEILNKELNTIKIGTASPIFKLAHCILAEKHNDIIGLVKKALATDELDMARYKEWPLYEFVRTNAEINAKIEAVLV